MSGATPMAVPHDYAQEPLDAQAMIDTLAPLVDANGPLHWALLVDTVFDEGRQTRPAAPDLVNCFAEAGGALADLASIAPCLVPLETSNEGPRRLTEWVHHAGARPMLGVLASRIDPYALARHWAPLHLVHMRDGERLLLRWADTRTASLLPQLLTRAQWQGLTAPLAHWFTFDRQGQPVRCAPQPGDAGPPVEAAPAPWHFDDGQLQQCLDHAEADALHGAVRERLDELGAAVPQPGTLHRHTQAALALARDHGAERIADRVALAAAAGLTDGACLNAPRLTALLQSRAWPPGHLFETLLQEGCLSMARAASAVPPIPPKGFL